MNTYWNAIACWQRARAPNRPTAAALGILVAAARKLPQQTPICVLGSTVEYRAAIHSLGFSEVTVIDRSREFYESTIANVPNSERERFINDDWRAALPTLKSQFGLIASDFTLGNLPYEEQGSLQLAVNEALSGGGLFFDRILRFRESGTDLAVLDDKYRDLPASDENVNLFNSDYLFSSELITAAGIVNTSTLYTHLENRFESQKNHLALLRATALLTPPGHIWWYGKPWHEVEEWYLSPAFASTEFHDFGDFGGNCTVTLRIK